MVREQAKLAREQAALKTAKLKLQEEIKNNLESTDESDSESRSESESDEDDDDEDDDDGEDESEGAGDSSRKRKRAESNGKSQPMSKKARRAWKQQQLEATRREYAEIVGNKPGNRIRNNLELMKKAIEKTNARPRKSGR